MLVDASLADEAIDLLEQLVGAQLTEHALRLDPFWDPIREHPRFQALLQSGAGSN
jgi:hypothetical protein